MSDEQTENRPEADLADTFDAQVWVREWLRTIEEHPDIPTDEGTMLAWFASAIMAGYDHGWREAVGTPGG